MESFCIRRRTLTTVDLYEGQISLSEFAVLNVLHDRADISTGGWKINSTALATFCGGSLSGASRGAPSWSPSCYYLGRADAGKTCWTC